MGVRILNRKTFGCSCSIEVGIGRDHSQDREADHLPQGVQPPGARELHRIGAAQETVLGEIHCACHNGGAEVDDRVGGGKILAKAGQRGGEYSRRGVPRSPTAGKSGDPFCARNAGDVKVCRPRLLAEGLHPRRARLLDVALDERTAIEAVARP